jgi:hypothetical protein
VNFSFTERVNMENVFLSISSLESLWILSAVRVLD